MQKVAERVADALDRGGRLADTKAFSARVAAFDRLREESYRPWRDRFRERVDRAISQTEFYRRHDPTRLPVLDRAGLSLNFARLIPTDLSRRVDVAGRLVLSSSSGSSGQSVATLRSERDVMVAHLLREDLIQRYCPRGESIVCLSLEPETTATDEIKVQLVMNTRPCAGVLLPHAVTADPGALRAALRGLDRIDVITGSSYRIYDFIGHCVAAGVWPRPRVVLTSYDLLTSAMARQLRAAFDCPVHSVYGSAETDSCGWSCDFDRMHISRRFAYAEVLQTDESPARPDGAGRLVLTPLLSGEAMPLLRYDIGDEAAAASTCGCGEPDSLVLTAFRGRRSTTVVGESGQLYRYGDFLDVGRHLGLADFQFVTREQGRVELALGIRDAHLLTSPSWIIECQRVFRDMFHDDLALSLAAERSFVTTSHGKRDLVVDLVPASTQATHDAGPSSVLGAADQRMDSHG